MNAVFAWVIGIFNNVRNWWNNNHQQVQQDARQAFRRLDRWFGRLGRNIFRLMVIGVILNVIASYLYPEFPKRFPIIYGYFDGWLQFGEFAIKAALGGLYAFFTGNFSKFWAEYNAAFHELLHQFTQWMAMIHF
jgi:hypothetical protein